MLDALSGRQAVCLAYVFVSNRFRRYICNVTAPTR